MIDTPEELERLAADLKIQLAKPETLQKLFQTVVPHMAPGGRNLIYILAQVDRIGHLAMELLFLNTLYSEEYDRIIVLTGPTDQPGVNPAVLGITGPKFVHVETRDPMLPLLGFFDGGLLEMQGLHLLMVQPQRLTRDFGRALAGGAPLKPFTMDRHLRARGDAWMRSLDIDPDEPFVLLHVRDASYRPDKAHHLFRCADIQRYGRAIDRLVAHGFRVFRLGDASSPRAPNASDRVIDVPFAPGYEPFLDVYLSGRCAFTVNQASGPEALARCFGRPALTVNLMLEHLRLPLAGDLLMFKHVRRADDGSQLSYTEMLARGLPGFGTSKQFEEAGLLVEENTEAELDAAVAEMIERSHGDGQARSAGQARFLAIGQEYEARITADPSIIAKTEDFYAYAHPFGTPSQAFLEMNPGFLAD